jgi:hypothetical protein
MEDNSMSQHKRFAVGALAAAISAGVLVLSPTAHAERAWVGLFQDQYPTSLTDDNATPDGCQVCHTDDNGPQLNPYGSDWLNAWTGTTNDELLAAFVAIEGDDSDADPTGSDNITEINADTQPGFAEGDNAPGVIGLLDPADPLPDIAVNPLNIDFGGVTVGSSASGNVNIANVGSADLTVDSLSFTNTTSAEFSLPNPPALPLTIAPNTSENVTLEYAPTNEGTDNGTLEIASDSPGEELVSVALTGDGLPVVVDECVATVDPASIDFGSVEIGSTTTLSTTISNNGGAGCTVNASVINGGVFTLASASSFTVAAGTSTEVAVTYTPTAVGDDAGQLVLDVASPADSITVPLSGSGFEAPVEMLDLDIKRFSATKRVSVSRPKAIVPQLSVLNNGVIEGDAIATVTGVQGGNPVYQETLLVTDGVGNGSTKYDFPSYVPDTEGDIVWTAVINDEDPDDDVATTTTTVVP